MPTTRTTPSESRKNYTDGRRSMRTASLVIVGTGMRAALDTTIESRTCIERASKVLYLVADSRASAWIEQLNPSAESLVHFYETGKPRFEIYEAIINEILGWLKRTP